MKLILRIKRKIKIKGIFFIGPIRALRAFYNKILFWYVPWLNRNSRMFKILDGRVVKIRIPQIEYPVFLRLGTSDIAIFEEIFLIKEYDKIKFERAKIIIDAGANIGLFAVLMKNIYPEAKIVCIEPDIENVEILKKNVSSYNHVYVENRGLWNKDTKLKAYDKYNSGKWGIIVEEDLVDGSISAITVKSLMNKYSFDHIDIFKIDIEGSEKQLFSNNFDSWLPAVKCLVIELHDWMVSGCSKPFFEAINKCFLNYSSLTSGANIIISDVTPNKNNETSIHNPYC